MSKMVPIKILTKGGRKLTVDHTQQPYADLIKRGDVQVIEETRVEKVAEPEEPVTEPEVPVVATVTVPDGLHEMRKSELVEWAAENNVAHDADANMKDIKAAIEAAAGA